jgi:hypothetical protein
MAIKSIEWLGFFEAEKVDVKSDWMRDEVIRIYKVPRDKITVVSPTADSWINEVLSFYKTAVAGGKVK